MSSFAGHVLAGTTVFFAGSQTGFRQEKGWLAWLVFLSILPDMDYLPYWIFNFHPAYRLTHSAGFCLVPVTATFFFLRKKDEHAGEKTFQAFCAAFSHLLLDSLVAVHPNPLFWPFSYAMIKLPCGPLPSAGALNISNYFLWRNLAIELGILVPAFAFIIFAVRRKIRNIPPAASMAGLCLWLVMVCWGLSLKR